MVAKLCTVFLELIHNLHLGLLAAAKTYAVLFLIVLVGAFLLVCWRIFAYLVPTSGFLVAFEEISAKKGTQLSTSRVLTALAIELLTPKKLRDDEFSMDIMPGSNEPGFSRVTPKLEPVAMPYQASDRPVKIGLVQFVPRELISLFSFRRPPTECIEGWLECKGKEAIASATYTHRRLFRPVRMRWVFRESGTHARTEVLRRLTAQIVVDLRKVDFTHDGRSYHELRSAIGSSFLDQNPQQGPLAGSKRRHLEDAVAYDPKNWIARFSLALELCNSGFPHEAITQFQLLEQLIHAVDDAHKPARSADSGGSVRVKEIRGSEAFRELFQHLRNYPACPYLIRYNKAIALAARDISGDSREALKILGELSLPSLGVEPKGDAATTDEQGTRDPLFDCRLPDAHSESSAVPLARSNIWPAESNGSLSPKVVAELRLNAISAKAHLTAKLGWRRGEFEREERKQIEDVESELDKVCLPEQEHHWRSFQTAKAVALGAKARALIMDGEAERAVEALEGALAAEPTFSGARTLLAEAYLRFQDQLRINWASLARSELLLGLRLNRDCKDGLTLLAVTYSSNLINCKSESERIYRQLGCLPSLSFWFGRLLVNTKARRCAGLFTVQRYLATCAELHTDYREKLELLASKPPFSEANGLSLEGRSHEIVAAVRLVLDEVEKAGVPVPAKLLENSRKQLESLQSPLAARA